jgi:hypothetical protein
MAVEDEHYPENQVLAQKLINRAVSQGLEGTIEQFALGVQQPI